MIRPCFGKKNSRSGQRRREIWEKYCFIYLTLFCWNFTDYIASMTWWGGQPQSSHIGCTQRGWESEPHPWSGIRTTTKYASGIDFSQPAADIDHVCFRAVFSPSKWVIPSIKGTTRIMSAQSTPFSVTRSRLLHMCLDHFLCPELICAVPAATKKM